MGRFADTEVRQMLQGPSESTSLGMRKQDFVIPLLLAMRQASRGNSRGIGLGYNKKNSTIRTIIQQLPLVECLCDSHLPILFPALKIILQVIISILNMKKLRYKE